MIKFFKSLLQAQEPITPMSDEQKLAAAKALLNAEVVNKIKQHFICKIAAGVHPIVYDNNDWVKDTGKERIPAHLKPAFYAAFMQYPAARWLCKSQPPHMKVTLSKRGGNLFGLLAIDWNDQPDFNEKN